MASHAIAHPAPQPVGGPLVTPVTVVLFLLALGAAAVGAVRLVYGLGAVTNLNDGYPWGIWIAYDLATGAALSTGGFALAILVYILNKGEYHPLVRPALLASLLGYTLASVSLFFDIGRYWNGWRIFSPWDANITSTIFELGTCMTAYIGVMFIEFSPALMERFGMKSFKARLEKVLFILVALGIVLPMMHQSSIGAMLIVFGSQIDPLWRTVLLPLLFLISCITMGYAMVIFEATMVTIGFKRPAETRMLTRLSTYMVGLLVLYLVVRVADLTWRGAWGHAFDPGVKSLMFWIENALFAAPIAILWTARARASASRLFLGAVCMALAGFLLRVDSFLIAYDTGEGWHYFPSLGEVTFTVGMIAAEILMYIVAVRLLPILPAVEKKP